LLSSPVRLCSSLPIAKTDMAGFRRVATYSSADNHGVFGSEFVVVGASCALLLPVVAVTDAILVILFRRTPVQISNSVVGLDVVVMKQPQSFRPRFEVGEGHQVSDSLDSGRGIVAVVDRDAGISLSSDVLLESTTVLPATIGDHLSLRGDCVSASNGSFFHKHNSSIGNGRVTQ